METVNERSSAILVCTFRDQDGNPVVPASATYRVDDRDGGEVRPTTAFTPSGEVHELALESSDTAILGTAKEETRIVTVVFQYGAGKQGTDFFKFRIVNLLGVS